MEGSDPVFDWRECYPPAARSGAPTVVFHEQAGRHVAPVVDYDTWDFEQMRRRTLLAP